MSTEVILRVNGIRAAFIASMGLDSSRQQPFFPVANTSISLIIRREGAVSENILFDCGEGVVASMVAYGLHQVTRCFLTHSHIDHIVGLDGLMVTQRASGGVCPLPLYCTGGTWQDGPAGRFPWLCGLPVARSPYARPLAHPPEPMLDFHPLVPFQPIDLDLGIRLRVTPVPVYHGASSVEPVIFIVEFGDAAAGTYHKLGFFWDMIHFIPRYPWEAADDLYIGSCAAADGWLPEHETLFAGLEEVFIDSSFITPISYISHRPLSATLGELLPRLLPSRAWVIHYDGTLDPGGPLTPDQMRRWIAENRSACPSAMAIDLAEHGMTLVYSL